MAMVDKAPLLQSYKINIGVTGFKDHDVATNWEWNERAVDVAKSAWFLTRGFRNNSSGKHMNDAWG